MTKSRVAARGWAAAERAGRVPVQQVASLCRVGSLAVAGAVPASRFESRFPAIDGRRFGCI
jgi:hypothetical protein